MTDKSLVTQREEVQVTVSLTYDAPANMPLKQQRETIFSDIQRLLDPDESEGYFDRCELQKIDLTTINPEAEIYAPSFTVFFRWPSGTTFIDHIEIIEPEAFSGNVEETAREYFGMNYEDDPDILAEWNSALFLGYVEGLHEIQWYDH